jgi:hypothetical protein
MSSQLPLPFTLRPNRAAHPGTPDMPCPRRSTETVQAQREVKENEKLAKAQSRKNTISKVAQVEAEMRQTHEEKRGNAHNPPPVVVDRVPRPRPPSGAGDLGHGELQVFSSSDNSLRSLVS